MLPIEHTQNILNLIRQKTDKVLLFYSCGKDSIVLLDLLAKNFKEVVCVFEYFVRDLKHINGNLKFMFERYNNVRLIQIPHWRLSTFKKYGIFCDADEQCNIMKLAYFDSFVRVVTGINYSFYGMRMSDGYSRYITLKTYRDDAICCATNKIYPLSHWKESDVLSYIKQYKLPQPIRYSETEKTGGLSFKLPVFKFLEKNFPEDLEKIFKEYPLSKAVLIKSHIEKPQIKKKNGGRRKKDSQKEETR